MTLGLTAHGRPGALVAVCGFDGSGKSTLENELVAAIAPTRPCVAAWAPSNWWREDARAQRTLFGKGDAPELPEQALLLFNLADCYAHQAETIVPALDRGEFVIANRYLCDMLALFEARGRTSLSWVRDAVVDLVRPDLCVVLDGPADLIVDRVVRRDGEIPGKFDQDAAFVERYNTALRRMARENGATVLRADAPLQDNVRRCLTALQDTGLWQGSMTTA
jgi:thymidylate kinase